MNAIAPLSFDIQQSTEFCQLHQAQMVSFRGKAIEQIEKMVGDLG